MATIRSIVIKRAARLDMTAYAIARDTKGAVSPDQVQRFMAGTGDITSARLDAVMKVLGLEIRPKSTTNL